MEREENQWERSGKGNGEIKKERLGRGERRIGQIKDWLDGWVLWHIKLCRLFNAKYISMQIISSLSNNSV